MHVSGIPFDLYPLFRYLISVVVIAIGILHLVRSTASKYFLVDDASFEVVENRNQMAAAVAATGDGCCAVCGDEGIKKCSRCKRVRYCSGTCQSKHWKDHKLKCQDIKLYGGVNATSVKSCGGKASASKSKPTKELPQLKKVLFPYEDFVKLFNRVNLRILPCGLLNCGNSCYANVVLQCLSCTQPLVAYLLEIGHVKRCRRNDWCFLCELERHVERARHSWQPFSPINILSRLPHIGGNLGYGKQEDAHEFMRFAIDTMQSVCLDEFGGEKAIHPSSQETTLIHYIFGGHLQSQVKCLKCNKISYRHENMMDLTVEIQGDAESLEECLDQFTAEEWLDGDNMYKCDGCNDYVKACKRLAIHHAPNILTIALKRFQSGRFGKLNKRVTFPETLDLGPYMSEPGRGTDIYRLYAVVVHIDMLNASYFGHYICYTKDFCGNWYRIDDCKVTTVELEEVLVQGAYMLLYIRTSVRPSCDKSLETCEENQNTVDTVEEAQPCSQLPIRSITNDSMAMDVESPTEEQQGLNVAEEPQLCLQLPVEFEESNKPLSTIPSDMRLSTGDNSDCVNLDDPVDVTSGFAKEDPAASSADVPILPLDMELEEPLRLDLMPTKGDQLNLDSSIPESSSLSLKLDDCGSRHSVTTGIAASKEVLHGGVLASVTYGDASPLLKAHSLDCEISGPNSEGHTFEKGNKTTAGSMEPISDDALMYQSLTSQSNTHEMADTLSRSGLNSVTEVLDGSSSSFSFLPNTPMVVSTDTYVNMIPAAQTTNRHTSNWNGKAVIKSVEDGAPCITSTNCNGFTDPGVSQYTNVVHGQNNGVSSCDDLHMFSLVNSKSENFIIGDEGDDDCSSASTHPAESAREDPTASNEDVPIVSSFSSLDMDLDGLDKLDLIPTRRDHLDLGSGTFKSCSTDMKLDDSGGMHSDGTGLVSAVESLHERALTSGPSIEAPPLLEAHCLECEVSVTNSGNHIFDNGSRTGDKELLSVKNSLHSQNGIHELAKAPGPNSVAKIVNVNSSSFYSPITDQVNSVKFVNMIPAAQTTNGNISRSLGDRCGKQRSLVSSVEVGISSKVKSNCNGVTKPGVSQVINVIHECNGVFNSDDHNTHGLLKRKSAKGLNGVEPVDDGSCMSSHVVEFAPVKFAHSGSLSPVDHEMGEISSSVPFDVSRSDTDMLDESNYVRSFKSPQNSSLDRIASAELCNGIDAVSSAEASSSNLNLANPCFSRFIPTFSRDFLDKQTRGEFQNRNDVSEVLEVVGSSCNVNNCNGSTSPGSLLQNSKKDNSYDSIFHGDNLVNSRIIQNQQAVISMDEDEKIHKALGEANGRPLSHCNGNSNTNNFGVNNFNIKDPGHQKFRGDDKGAFFPVGFLNKPPQKKFQKNNVEDPISSELVSSNHDRNRLPRVG